MPDPLTVILTALQGQNPAPPAAQQQRHTGTKLSPMRKPRSTLLLVNNYWTRYLSKKWVEAKPMYTNIFIHMHSEMLHITFCFIPFSSPNTSTFCIESQQLLHLPKEEGETWGYGLSSAWGLHPCARTPVPKTDRTWGWDNCGPTDLESKKKKKSSESRFMGLEERNYRKPRGHAMLSGGLERSAKASPAPWKNFNGNQFHLMGFQSLPYKLMSSDTAMLSVPSWAGQHSAQRIPGTPWDAGNTQLAWDHFD